MREWIPTAGPTARPPESNQRVDWISPDGSVVEGGRFQGGGLWFLPDDSMYVYYQPAFWRPAKEER